MVKVSVVVTVKNEEQTLLALFCALEKQTHPPDEVIIVDGGSTDGTYKLLKTQRLSCRKIVIRKTGNRSMGRNLGISVSQNAIIAITDAGCEPDPHWIQELVRPFYDEAVDVVAGYYRPLAQSPFEQAAATYMLVMPDKLNPQIFLPATRSMALRKSIWEKIGGFPVAYSMNEDYVFAHRLKKIGATIVFQKTAVVTWQPPKTWGTFLTQIHRFAVGDTQAGIFRPKMITIFLRYLVFTGSFFLSPLLGFALFFSYLLWAFWKNQRYVRSFSAIIILPIMQVGTDIAVMIGSIQGGTAFLFEKIWPL